MTWRLEIQGHSQTGPDEKSQQDYLAKKFGEVVKQINSENVTQVSSAMLDTNVGQYDVIAQREFQPSGQTK